MSESAEKAIAGSSVILVPCAWGEGVGCQIARRAVELVAADTPEAEVAEAEDCPRSARRFIVAVDGSSKCSASQALAECKVRPAVVVSAPEVLARAGLVKPGVDVRGRMEDLAAALAAEIEGSLQEVLEEVRERERYRTEMAPVLQRFRGIWTKFEAFPPPPNGGPPEPDAKRVELIGKRSRNLFVRFDEVVPPAEWAEPHDLFQDALLCIAYACEGWVAGDSERWEHNLDKARVQIEPLLRRLET
ncbi:MAG: hypothetical protein JSV79_09830 [Armatimonadota bacterium]|nr:MAG: hypothetical protein JSV79_09830 [Armatimonadota bacterium]